MATVAETLAPEIRNCGSCGLWGANFYPKREGWPTDTTCCADVAMDLPASFIPARQTMTAEQGDGCICWRPVEAAAAKARAS